MTNTKHQKANLKLLILALFFSCTIFSQKNKITTSESLENDIEVYIKNKILNFQINPSRLTQIIEDKKGEEIVNKNTYSKSQIDSSMIELKRYELRKKYFEENPEKLKIFTSKLSSNNILQICNDGDFENWPAANQFLFKRAVYPTNGSGINIITTGSDFVPFTVGSTVDNFGNLATLVSQGQDIEIPSINRVFNGNKSIKLNFPQPPYATYQRDVVTMSRGFTVNQNFLDFNYCVILNDPGNVPNHPNPGDRPYFLVRIYDTNFNILRSVNVLANPNDCSFSSTTNNSYSDNLLYTGWQCGRIDMSNLMGQNVIVEFIVADCLQGGHYGTVYIDDICSSNCANPLFGIINLNPLQTIFCPTSSQTICGTYQTPLNSTLNSITLYVMQNNAVIATLNAPTITSSTFCFTVPLSSFGNIPTGNFEFVVKGDFTRQCTLNYQLDPIYDYSTNDSGNDVTFISPRLVPLFVQESPICSGSRLSALPTTSINGITGNWTPPINNTTTTTYTFTPNNGLCTDNATMTIVVNPILTPTFIQIAPICSGTSFSLPATSTNGITGTWTPSPNNTVTTTYTFTPTTPCANTTTMTVTVKPNTAPLFNQVPPICRGGTPVLWPPTPTNIDVDGTWTPAFNNNATTTYTFTPTAVIGQCVTTTTMTVQVNGLQATNDTFTGTPINSLTGGQTASVINNDLVNGVLINSIGYPFYITMTNITVTPVLTFIPSISINNLGNIILPAGTPVGTYTITYSIIDPNCRNTNTSSATATVVVNSVDILTPTLTPGIRANDIVSNVDTQSNGSIIITGYFTTYNNISCKKIARLNTNLTLDQTFNVDGPNPTDQVPWDMKVIKNTGSNYNKIIVGGSFSGWGTGTNGIAIARLNVDGTIDNTFNSGVLANVNALRGFYTSLTSSITKGTVFSIYVIPDGLANAGKILVGGQFNRYNGYEAYNLAMLNPDGSFDTTSSFNTNVNTIINSVPIQSSKGFNSAVGGIITQSNNQVLVAGAFDWYNGVQKSGLLRLNVNGTLDTSYNSTTVYSGLNPGFVSGSLGSGYAAFHKKLVLQPDGKLIVGGYFGRYNNNTANNIVRINTNGSFDTSFVTGAGFKNDVLNPIGSEPGIVRDLVLNTQSSNDWVLYVAGDFLAYKNVTCNEIIRIKCSTFSPYTAGDKDTGFDLGGGGPNGINNGPIWCMKRQPGDGKIIIGGRFINYNGIPALNVTRIFPSASSGEAKSNTIYYDSEQQIDLFSDEKIVIYPNPNDGIFNIKLNNDFIENSSLIIYDIMGKKVYENENLDKGESKINLSNLTKGTYFINIKNSKTSNNVTKTIIIK